MSRYSSSKTISTACLVLLFSLVCKPVFADTPYYLHYSQDGTFRIIGKLQLLPTYDAPVHLFEIDANGNITKVSTITASGRITAPYFTATSSFSVASSLAADGTGIWTYVPVYFNRTLSAPYGISCSTLQITAGAAEGYVATSDVYGNITLRPPLVSGSTVLTSTNIWTGINSFYQEGQYFCPIFVRAGGFASSISKYGNGPFYIYTIGDDLVTDATNYYLNSGKMKISCSDNYGMYIGSGATVNDTVNTIKLDMGTVVRGTMTATAFCGDGSGLTGMTKHSSFVVRLATSTDDFCFFKPKYRPVTIISFEAIVSTYSGISSSWTGKLQRTDSNGFNAEDISWNSYTVNSSVEFSTNSFNTNSSISTNQRVKLETISTTGSVDTLAVDVWYREN